MKPKVAMEWLVDQVIYGVDLTNEYFRLILKDGYVELDATGEVYISTTNDPPQELL
jgi:hypothetical protein